MGVTSFKSLLQFGTRAPLGQGGSENPDLAPAMFWGGGMIIDPRVGYNVTRKGALGWYAMPDMVVIDQVPSAISATNIAAAQAAVAATPLTLVSTTGAGITVLATALQVWASSTVVPVGALAIDGVPGILSFGLPSVSTGTTTISAYDPTKAIARNLRYTSVGNDSGGTITAVGYDLYGYPQTETVTLANAGIASGVKTFKFITSITPAGSISGSNISVGTGDVYGFPIRVDEFALVGINWNNTSITANTGFVAAVTTTATATTGDVRGTYATQSASDGTKKMTIITSLSPGNISTMASGSGAAGLVGVTPA